LVTLISGLLQAPVFSYLHLFHGSLIT